MGACYSSPAAQEAHLGAQAFHFVEQVEHGFDPSHVKPVNRAQILDAPDIMDRLFREGHHAMRRLKNRLHQAGAAINQNGATGDTSQMRGRDVEGDILVSLDEVLHGSERTIRLQRTDPRTGESATQTLRVKIPPGVREGQMIRLAGKGQEGIAGGESGHLYLRVAFAKHPEFRVRGADLYYDLELAPWEAVLGATIHIPTLDGTVALKIPPGTVAEREFRLRGLGLPVDKGTRGDLHAIVSIAVPSQPTPEQKNLWEQLAAKSTFNPRKNP